MHQNDTSSGIGIAGGRHAAHGEREIEQYQCSHARPARLKPASESSISSPCFYTTNHQIQSGKEKGNHH